MNISVQIRRSVGRDVTAGSLTFGLNLYILSKVGFGISQMSPKIPATRCMTSIFMWSPRNLEELAAKVFYAVGDKLKIKRIWLNQYYWKYGYLLRTERIKKLTHFYLTWKQSYISHLAKCNIDVKVNATLFTLISTTWALERATTIKAPPLLSL